MDEVMRTPGMVFGDLLEEEPQGVAWIRGGGRAPYLSGLVKFFETHYGGVLIAAELFGLPELSDEGDSGFYAMYIRIREDRSGDLIPLCSCQGYAWLAFYDKRLTMPEIIGKPVAVRLTGDETVSRPADKEEDWIGSGVIRLADGKDGKDGENSGKIPFTSLPAGQKNAE